MKIAGITLGLSLAAILAPGAVADNEVLEEVVEQDYPIDPGAKFTLQNDDGSVQIYGADIAQMKLQAIKRAYSKERLSKINVNVAVRPGMVAVKTGYPPKSKWGLSDRSGTVDYIIILPWRCDVERVELGNGEIVIDGMRGNEVHARLGNGRLFGHNCFTNFHASIGGGGLEVLYQWWEAHPIALDTKISEGTTWLYIPATAQLRLHAETGNGRILSDFGKRQDQFQRPGPAKVDLLVGDNSPNAEMQLHSRDGSINIKEYSP